MIRWCKRTKEKKQRKLLTIFISIIGCCSCRLFLCLLYLLSAKNNNRRQICWAIHTLKTLCASITGRVQSGNETWKKRLTIELNVESVGIILSGCVSHSISFKAFNMPIKGERSHTRLILKLLFVIFVKYVFAMDLFPRNQKAMVVCIWWKWGIGKNKILQKSEQRASNIPSKSGTVKE